jgi:hypothetical protein
MATKLFATNIQNKTIRQKSTELTRETKQAEPLTTVGQRSSQTAQLQNQVSVLFS